MNISTKKAVCIAGKTAKKNNFKQNYTNTPRHLQGLTPLRIARLSNRPVRQIRATIERLRLQPIPDSPNHYPPSLVQIMRGL